MEKENLLKYKSDVYSQNGEDGIINAIFERIDTTSKICCEFGAWDGIHLSNCRNLILNGWTAVMIEGDEVRYNDLIKTYKNNESVYCVNKFVDAVNNSLGAILIENNINDLDFLSVDIDGLDYEIFETLDVRPKVICIEVNAGHNPENSVRLSKEVAKNNVGQSLEIFLQIAKDKGYDLVCYNGNAFLIRTDLMEKGGFISLTSKEAYQKFMDDLSIKAKEWLYLVNLGKVDPLFHYNNPHLTREVLGISMLRSLWLKFMRRV